MLVLVFDTETTGLPSSRIISPDTLPLWPHIVQLSYVIYDTENNDIVYSSDSIVKVKESVIITEDSSKFHKITNEISQTKGIKLDNVLDDFFHHLKKVDMIVGHNISFDINMVKVELLRIIYEESNISDVRLKECKYDLHLLTNFKNICCTLQDSITICNIKALDRFGKEYLKYPKLIELHQILFDSSPNNLHNSFNDILVTLRCFMKLKHDKDLNEMCDKFKEIAKSIQLL
jgi:DNA polymerase III epsilon subunit-like protein